jgi:hypothetical protein
MYLIREIFTAKPGQASKLAKLFKQMNMPGKVMTDMVGPYNTVVMEMEIESLAEWEKQMKEYKSAKPDPKVDPKVAEEMSHYTEMYLTGRREIYKIE